MRLPTLPFKELQEERLQSEAQAEIQMQGLRRSIHGHDRYLLFSFSSKVPDLGGVHGMRAEWSDIGTGVIGNREAGPYLFQYEAQALFRCRQEAEGTIERAGGAGCHIYQDQPEGHQERGHA